jgi:heme/copper-type cytochrome/quinol oxidase subunit 2
MGSSRASVIQQKLEQKPLDSKKAVYALIATLCVLVVFGISAALILFHAEAAKEIVELANLVVIFLGAIASIILTGQSCVDWKAMSVLQHMDKDETETIESNQALPQVEANTQINTLRRDPKDYLLEHDTSF